MSKTTAGTGRNIETDAESTASKSSTKAPETERVDVLTGYVRKHWFQDAFYFVTLDFNLYNEPRRVLELYLRKTQKELHYDVSVLFVVTVFKALLYAQTFNTTGGSRP